MLPQLAQAHGDLARSFKGHDPVQLASGFAGLLLLPELQRHNLRLEALVHLALAWGQGGKAPTVTDLRQGFAAMGSGACGYLEDPPEDLFVELIISDFGQHRILAGSWESTGYHLQRLVDVVQGLPVGPGYDDIKSTCRAALALSDAVCQRAGLERYAIGRDDGPAALAPQLAIRGRQGAGHLDFSHDDLLALDVELSALEPLILDREAADLLSQPFGRTPVERQPVVRTDGGLTLVLPTAISTALRFFVIGALKDAGLETSLTRALAEAHVQSFEHNRIVEGRTLLGLPFHRAPGALIGSGVRQVEPGRYLQVLLVVDDLTDFDATGLVDPNPLDKTAQRAIDHYVAEGMKTAAERPDFREGVVLVVLGGVGRSGMVGFARPEDPRWDIRGVSAADLATLDALDGVSALSLFRLTRTENRIEELGGELFNINGLLNVFGWMRQLDGHLIPHAAMGDGFLGEGAAAMIVVDQTALRPLREEAARGRDRHLEQEVSGAWVPVQRSPPTVFAEDRLKPRYFSEVFPPSGVFITDRRTWWCRCEVRPGTPNRLIYERWRVVDLWLSRAADRLERAFPDLPPGPVEWTARFDAELSDRSGEQEPMPFEVAQGLVQVAAEPGQRRVTTTCLTAWEDGHAQAENIAERALVDGLVRAVEAYVCRHLEEMERTALVAEIMGGVHARQQHGFRTVTYRDLIRGSLPSPVTIEREDDAGGRIGLGWKVRAKERGPWIEGKAECIEFLNALVTRLEDDLIADIRLFERKALLEALLLNHEAAARDLSHWSLTAAASLELHDDAEAAAEEIGEWSAKLNAVNLTTRILIEMAVCEAPSTGGHSPGDLDLCRMMAQAALVFHFGGDSDAIRWDVMEPKLRITPFGDVHANHEFSETIVVPFGKQTTNRRLREAVAEYGSKVEGPETQDRPEMGSGFDAAIEEAFGAPPDSLRILTEKVDELGLEAARATIVTRESQLILSLQEAGAQRAPELLNALTLRPRATWRDTPVGFSPKDLHPWRFRRRLSVLRRPILALGDGEDPELLIAPGLLREALAYSLSNYQRGHFPEEQLGPLMRSWKARIDGQHGAFAQEVGAALKAAGWRVEIDVPITKVIGTKLDRDYGDLDVLAFHPNCPRVLLIECKDLQFRKTFGEVAEQLADYRGEERNGKRDKLRRHLDRVEVMTRHLDRLKNYTRIEPDPVIEAHLIFRNPVPMTFAIDRMKGRTSVLTMSDIDQIAPPI